MFLEKKKFMQMVILTAVVATLIVPVANAEMKIKSVDIPNEVTSNPPRYGEMKFTIVTNKTIGQSETLQIPVIVNGTTVTTVTVQMKVNETLKSVPVNVQLQGAVVQMVNPFEQPISHIHYEIDVGGFGEVISLLVYPDWSIWALIADVLVMGVLALIMWRFAKS